MSERTSLLHNMSAPPMTAIALESGPARTYGSGIVFELPDDVTRLGARALLVSHWAVDSDAAAKLTTTTFDVLQNDRKLGRAEALHAFRYHPVIGGRNGPDLTA